MQEKLISSSPNKLKIKRKSDFQTSVSPKLKNRRLIIKTQHDESSSLRKYH